MAQNTLQRAWTFGSVSHGTLRAEDLLEAFLWECGRRFKHDLENRPELAKIIRIDESIGDIDEETVYEAYYASEYVSELVNETLPDMLNEDLPDFVYFGTHPGDGSDFGYWFSHDAFEQSVDDGATIKVEDFPEDLEEFRAENPDAHLIAVISDHGNIALYSAYDGSHLYE